MFNPDSYSEERSSNSALTKWRVIPFLHKFEATLERFSLGERLALYTLTTLFIGSALGLLAFANAAVSVEVPAYGGSMREGVVGSARFVNPLLSLSGPDKDMTALVYSGLMRASPEGTLIPDLAEKYDISEDGMTYTFTLREGLTFHDGSSLTSTDVLFTIQRAQNPEIKSPRRADWEGVSVATPDERTIVFTLPHPYAPFIENATLGILPKHLWEHVSAEEFPFSPINTRPVGSGPYMVTDLNTNTTGSATKYTLTSFSKFALGEPHIAKIEFLFYQNEEELVKAFNDDRVDSIAGISPSEVAKITRSNSRIVHAPLPRTFGVFFNLNKNAIFADTYVRTALDAAIDKKLLINQVLEGYGAILESPIPPGILGTVTPATPRPIGKHEEATKDTSHAEEARAILSRGGWAFNEAEGVWKKKDAVLSFTLATADEPELSGTAEALAQAWRDVGVKVDVHVYPISELNSLVLRPRNYDAMLFGEVVGRTLDLFAFWHSSQRNDPGLNIALYTNSHADSLLAKARATTNEREREKLYKEFIDVIEEDHPAVFLYAPEFIYIVPENINGVALGAITGAHERFLNVYEWYTDTERVWDIFSNNVTE